MGFCQNSGGAGRLCGREGGVRPCSSAASPPRFSSAAPMPPLQRALVAWGGRWEKQELGDQHLLERPLTRAADGGGADQEQ